jgi:hypothetical protein
LRRLSARKLSECLPAIAAIAASGGEEALAIGLVADAGARPTVA